MRKELFFGIIFIFLIGNVFAATGGYTYSNPKLTGSSSSVFTSYSSNFGSTFYDTSFFDKSMCEEGQDFLVRVDAQKCTPIVVRSDLLEEEDIPVFCPVQAIKINPLIDVSSIDSISFSGKFPSEVKTVGFTPVYSALGGNRKLNNYQWDNVGYVTVILRKNANESSMPDFINLNLTARITYDLKDGFGLLTHSFYLPVMNDNVFEERMGEYAFFNHMGYLRADSVEEDSATISIYRDLYQNPMKSDSTEKQRLQTFDLKVGQSSPKITLPGFECLSKVQFTLKKVDFADTSANFLINSEYVGVREEETFLNGLCTVKKIDALGVYQSARVVCRNTDDGTKTFDFKVAPKAIFNIDGTKISASLGDKIGTSKNGEDLFYAYMGKQGDSLNALIIALPSEKGITKLSESDLKYASFLGDNQLRDSSTLGEIVGGISTWSVGVFKYLQSGTSKAFVSKGKEEMVSDSRVSFIGLGIKENEILTDELVREYEDSIEDYDRILSNYLGVKYPDNDSATLAEYASMEKINLAEAGRQYEDVQLFCLDFKKNFASSSLNNSLCDNELFLSNEGVSVQYILINGDYKKIVFNGVTEPAFEDYGASIVVRDLKTGISNRYYLKKNTQIVLDEATGESFSLEGVYDKSIKIGYSLKNLDMTTKISSIFSNTTTLPLARPTSLNERYEFNLQEINLNRMAYVVAEPSVNYQASEANFNYKIGVEKRLIQLSPEKARSVAEKVNDSLKTMQDISDGLDFLTKRMKEACLATGGYLTLKNLIFSTSGETIARKEIMEEWKNTCMALVNEENSKYNTLEGCYFDHAKEIDSEVEAYTKIMSEQEKELKSIVEGDSDLVVSKGGLFGSDIINSTGLVLRYSPGLIANLEELKREKGTILTNPFKLDDTINLDEIIKIISKEENAGTVYEIDDLKSVDLYYQLYYNNQSSSNFMKLFSSLSQIVVNEKKYSEYISSQSSISESNNQRTTLVASSSGAKIGSYGGYKTEEGDGIWGLGEIPEEVLLIQEVQLPDGKRYYVSLSHTGIDVTYRIKTVYDIDGKDLGYEGIKIVSEYYSFFETQNAGFYFYEIKPEDNKIKYFASGSFRDLPSIVPFDRKNGWYAKIDNGLSSVTSYSDSARIESFYLCNVMMDGKIEVVSGGDKDECALVMLSNTKNVHFSRLSASETQKLVDQAVKSISVAGSASNKKGNIQLPNGEFVSVGEPQTSTISRTSCSDFMSPKECNILFNLCDPVICPESRCNYGGKYPVQDVIQSGIVGSLLLCSPNAKEGIKLPVCVSGVNAGVKALMSVTEAYRDCLIESAETGKTVGICDEIHSIYLCEFLWKQAIPLMKIAAPAVLTRVLEGETTRGGGEYLSILDAWNNAQNSIDYFVQSYGVQAYKAFKARSQEEIGTAVCKSFVSVVYPTGLGDLSILTTSDNPPQFIAKFEEIPYSSTTNPPMSQYKVYYHVYAGEDSGVYYSIYLRGNTGSYYEDSAVGRRVDSGYIQSGSYATETVDFLGPVGYTELCVRINDELEECGFGTVSTDFAVNYLSDVYIQKQSGQTNIKTEEECIYGTTSLLSVLNLNLQNAANNLISPDILSKGIVRICSTSNPGIGNDVNYGDAENQRWIKVGYCGNENMGCWIDKGSLEKAFNWEQSYNDVMNDSLLEASRSVVDKYLDEANLWDEAKFSNFLDSNLSNQLNPVKKINLINSVFANLYFNNHKAYLLLQRGKAYGEIVRESFIRYFVRVDESRREESTINYNNGTVVLEKIGINNFIGSEYIGSKFKIVSKGTDFCYKYFDGEWHWTDDCENVEKELLDPYHDSLSPFDQVSYGVVNWKNISEGKNFNTDFAEEEKMISSLEGASYSEGLNLIFNRFTNRERPAKEILVSGKKEIEIDEYKVFLISGIPDIDELYLDFKSSKEWMWSFDGKEWFKLSELKQKDTTTWLGKLFSSSETKKSPKNLVSIPENYQTLFSALKGKDFLTGAMIIFENETVWKSVGKYESVGPVGEIDWSVVSSNCKQYNEMFKEASASYGVPLNLLIAIANQESACNLYATSYSGSAGLFQFTKGTAESPEYKTIFEKVYGCKNVDINVGKSGCKCSINCDSNKVVNECGCSLSDGRFDPKKSIEAGAKLISENILRYKETESSVEFGLIAYNGGPAVSNALISELKKEGKSLTWENALPYLTEELIGKIDDYKNLDNKISKVIEIKNYVSRIVGTANKIIVPGEGDLGVENNLGNNSFWKIPDSNLIGQKILSVAQSKINTDTCRLDGKFDNPCTAFVSNVLIESGVLSQNEYTESVEKLNSILLEKSRLILVNLQYVVVPESDWEKNLLPGDIVIWGGALENGLKPEFQHSTIFSNYDSFGNFVIIGDGGEFNEDGSNRLVSKSVYSKEGHENKRWYITHVYRSIEWGNEAEEVINSSQNAPELDEEQIVVQELRNKNWPVGETLRFAKDDIHIGRYVDSSLNKFFVDSLYSDGIISKKDYEEITGESDWLWNLDDMTDVYKLLLKIKESRGLKDTDTFVNELPSFNFITD